MPPRRKPSAQDRLRQRPLWTPSEERVKNANMTRFIEVARHFTGKDFKNYDDLYNWSITDIAGFWELIWKISGTIHSSPFTSVLSDPVMPGARWFEGARLNFARNLLRFRDDHLALVSWGEDRLPMRYTYAQLYEQVSACAAGLRKLGVTTGDRVAAMVPNTPEAVIAMLATTSIGAIWSSWSPDFGPQSMLDRFGQIEPKVLLSCDGYRYNGKSLDCIDKVREMTEKIPSIEKVVVIPVLSDGRAAFAPNSIFWASLMEADPGELEFAELPFDHPVYIMYSSGTTGKPKCIVHGAGGTLLQHYKELVLHTDLCREDVIAYYTTCGWMMWNWLVSSLEVGATIFLYDGSPTYPDVEVLWRAIDEERISIFGTSPKYLSACQQAGLKPSTQFGLSTLRTILSTGSPLAADNFSWVYKSVKSDLQLSSISGGTDIVSCFMLGNPLLPVHSEEIQCRGLGMKVEMFDPAGRSIVNEVGELVCTAPFPSMPVSFWNDPDGSKYRAAYFEDFPGAWRHGDFVRLTEHGGIVVYGRSDATLNPGGVRIGTAEIYSPVEGMDEIADSLVIGQQWHNDVRVVLFVVLNPGLALDDPLRDKIRHTILSAATPRHVPALILQVTEIPRTMNGKKVEIAVSRLIQGKDVPNRDALANPEALGQFANIPELHR
ncbi:MAG: acetoacetate--CoA ligase [candidate division Zixibacteria bacterium]|nr:acetoacetate--CoA ligase [candidate division Zixibacteria bacterium]